MRSLGTMVFRSVCILCASLTLVAAQSKTDALVPEMPGRLVATDAGHRLHIWCTGRGAPTVVLLNGGGGFSIDWIPIQRPLAEKTRVCSYDRAGYAWSDPPPDPHGLDTSAAELHQVLGRAGEHPPYVLVGSSWGGLIARVFADKHRMDVAGMVLVDATPWGIRGVTPKAVPDAVLMNLDSRAEEEPPSVTLPADVRVARDWARSRLPKDTPTMSPGFLSLEYSDPIAQDRAMSRMVAGNPVPLGDVPLVVISAGRVSWDASARALFPSYEAAQRAHIAEQASLAGLSRSGVLVVARESFHAVQFSEPQLIIDTVLRMLGS
jgi:pimeloyl-ACP methyl ester carboxylesterase